MADEDIKEKVLNDLRSLRGKLDPKILKEVELRMNGQVPYDKESARKTVELFLHARHDQGAFAEKVLNALKEKDQEEDNK
ncbi:hypothetical protein WH95_07095 [Kiloniella litopenaei]|uniref:Uncharacterized protein n=1 Tax=Kiloniella litopenaei TaxID=1549748 RepID=A0A0M2RAK9_9PROT|nr:hypothetical protein [Kiloniella litopenaei]KKJ77459.1 hypothetical protein WH95_07095 [Kiloniella litopenaei]